MKNCPNKYNHYFNEFAIIGLFDVVALIAAAALFLFLPIFRMNTEVYGVEYSVDYSIYQAGIESLKSGFPSGFIEILSFVLLEGSILNAIADMSLALIILTVANIKLLNRTTRDTRFNNIIESSGRKKGNMPFVGAFNFLLTSCLLCILYFIVAHFLVSPDSEAVVNSPFLYASGINLYLIVPVVVTAFTVIIHMVRKKLSGNMRQEILNESDGGYSENSDEVDDIHYDYDYDYNYGLHDDYDEDDYDDDEDEDYEDDDEEEYEDDYDGYGDYDGYDDEETEEDEDEDYEEEYDY